MAVTVTTQTVANYALTDAGFRLWGKAITDLLDAMGMTQDYSNIDWSTVTLPTVAGNSAGKRVYKFNDSLSGTREIYVALDFGRGSTTSATFAFKLLITVGTTHTSGTVGGSTMMSHYLVVNASPSGDGEFIGIKTDMGFAVMANVTSASNGYQLGFGVERLASGGDATADGAVMWLHGMVVDGTGPNPSQPLFRLANFASGTLSPAAGGSTSTSNTMWSPPCAIPLNSSTSAYLDKAPVFPVATLGDYDPLFGVISVPVPPYAMSNIFTANVNGVSGTYRIPSAGVLADSTGSGCLRLAYRTA